MHKKPNVIIILTDDQGMLDVNCFGGTHLHTPNLDEMASNGLKFTRQYVHQVCCPSRAALLTGRYPQRSNINNWTQNNQADAVKGINIFPDTTTMAQIYKEAGYTTMLAGKWHLGASVENTPNRMGFDRFYGFLGGFIDNYRHCFLHGEGFHDLWENGTELHHDNEYYPELVAEKAVEFIKEERDEPFFLYYAMNLPHYPEQYSAQFEEYYQEESDPYKKRYYKTISTMDAKIGEIIRTVQDCGIADDTIILYMSDNGHSNETGYTIECENHASGLPKGHSYAASGAGYTGKYLGNKDNLFEGGIRAPCILCNPALREYAGQARAATVSQCDWLPTLLQFCDIDASRYQFDGIDISQSVIRQGTVRGKDFIYLQWQVNWCIIKGNWKLMGNNQTGERKLLNVADAQPERIDHAAQEPALFEELYQDYLQTVQEIEQDPRVKESAIACDVPYPSAYIDEAQLQYTGVDVNVE